MDDLPENCHSLSLSVWVWGVAVAFTFTLVGVEFVHGHTQRFVSIQALELPSTSI